MYALYTQSYKRLEIFQFLTYILSADITPEKLKLCSSTKIKVFFFVVLVYVFNFDLFEFSAAILEGSVNNDRGKIDYFIESATYGFLFTSCKTLENERVSAANE